MTLRVLVVDDESLARSRLIRLLADCTAPGALLVGEAADATQAMQCVQHQQVDVVLADIHMPGVDGLSLATSLRALPHAPTLVFVTAHDDPAERERGLAAGAQGFISKPVNPQQVLAALRRLLG